MNERTIANRALEQLRFQTGLVGHVSATDKTDKTSESVEAVVNFDSIKTQLITYLRDGPINGRAMSELIELAQGQGNLIIGDYISDDDAERFRESNINYLDNVGNAFLNLPPVYVLIQGKRPRDTYSADKAAKLFTETGLRVIMALLCSDELLNASYRKIADYAGVSMGTIGWVLRELKNQGFIGTRKGRYAWMNRVKLVKMWTEEYPSLRQKYSLGNYYTQDANWWKNFDYNRYEAVLGGAISANETLAGFGAKSAELFVGKHRHAALIEDLHLIPESEIERLDGKIDEKGLVRIALLNKFWGQENSEDLFSARVPRLLTYASLMDSWDSRSRELAARIARQFL